MACEVTSFWLFGWGHLTVGTMQVAILVVCIRPIEHVPLLMDSIQHQPAGVVFPASPLERSSSCPFVGGIYRPRASRTHTIHVGRWVNIGIKALRHLTFPGGRRRTSENVLGETVRHGQENISMHIPPRKSKVKLFEVPNCLKPSSLCR